MPALTDTRPCQLSDCLEEEEIIHNCSPLLQQGVCSKVEPRRQKAISGFIMLVDKSCVAQWQTCFWMWDDEVSCILKESLLLFLGEASLDVSIKPSSC